MKSFDSRYVPLAKLPTQLRKSTRVPISSLCSALMSICVLSVWVLDDLQVPEAIRALEEYAA